MSLPEVVRLAAIRGATIPRAWAAACARSDDIEIRKMERFHFNIEDGKPYPDDEGTLLVDLPAARREALKVLTQAVMNWPDEFWRTHQYSVTVTDQTGLALFTLNLSVQEAAALGGGHDRPKR